MIKPLNPENEEKRLEELYRFKILDTATEKDFDDVVELASIICEVPISLITMIDASRQWFKSKKGIDWSETERDISFCGHAIYQNDLFIIEDATKDERFTDNPLVINDPSIRFYAGMPLTTENGYNLGTLCVIDSKPKTLNKSQKTALEILSNQVSRLIELREKKLQLEENVKIIEVQNKKLKNLNNQNNEMTSIISHDLRGPISSVRSYFNSDYFKNSSTEEKLKLMPVIKESVNGIHNLVENLLEWSQSVGDFNLSSLNLHQYIYEVIQLFQVQANKKNIKLLNKVDRHLKVLADSSMLRFILRNLTGNAIKFTENGSIELSSSLQEDGKICIAIKDSGVGMSEQLVNKLNKGEKKITTLGTRKEKGSGLGLKLINEFLERHNSSLEIKSKEGKGSTFFFTLSQA
ncbi:sensor histidine kinase [Marivirga lumbricoides]|uniref:histidine kinase n=1 Tax=Marivirga lumbricoides TaxID=1046115 RepID=A0ABQ1MS22_9BACT|nr:sensor histidine kinase [Marivirga lumbricoides]